MKSFDEGAVRLSDGELNALLQDYFAAEVLAELPPLPAGSGSRPGLKNAWARRLGFVEWLAYASLAASVLLTIGLRLKYGEGKVEAPALVAGANGTTAAVDDRSDADIPTIDAPTALVSGPPLGNVEYSVLERQDPVQTARFVTTEGTFERRTVVRWRISSVYEPRTGERVQWSTPVVSIEVSPVSAANRRTD